MLNYMNSEEQYKHIEDKITEAVNAADYAFNEASWKKMEALLDKNKDRRRPFFWTFSILLLGILLLGSTLIFNYVNKNEPIINPEKQSGEKNNDQQSQSSLMNKNNSINADQTVVKVDNSDSINKYISSYNSGKTSMVITGSELETDPEKTILKKNKKQAKEDLFKLKPDSKKSSLVNNSRSMNTDIEINNRQLKNKYKDESKLTVKITSPDMENDEANSINNTSIRSVPGLTDSNYKKTDEITAAITKPEIKKEFDSIHKTSDTTIVPESKKEKKVKSNKGFYVLAAAGLELNSSKFLSFKNSPVTPVYGAGLGYQFNRRLSIQTGFYAGAKKYVAGPDDYSVKPGSYLSTVKIIKVDANCMVYDIPVTLQYNWLIRKKTNYFAQVGISNYIMKKEEYIYAYERYNNYYSYPYDYTKNTHLFASLHLAVGIEKQIGRKLFLQASPVVNIPLQGVGEGQVTLFTTGLRAGLKYFPFKH